MQILIQKWTFDLIAQAYPVAMWWPHTLGFSLSLSYIYFLCDNVTNVVTIFVDCCNIVLKELELLVLGKLLDPGLIFLSNSKHFCFLQCRIGFWCNIFWIINNLAPYDVTHLELVDVWRHITYYATLHPTTATYNSSSLQLNLWRSTSLDCN